MLPAPGPVLQFRYGPVSFTQVHLQWSPPHEINGVLLSYTLTVHSENEARKYSFDRISKLFQVTNLRPGTQYRFSIQATTVAGDGPAVNYIASTKQLGMSATCSLATSSPLLYHHSHTGEVSNVAVHLINSTAVTVSWTPIHASLLDGETLLYLVTYIHTRQHTFNSTTVPFLSSNTTITGLISASSYVFEVSVAALINGSTLIRGAGVRTELERPVQLAGIIAGLIGIIVIVTLPVMIVGGCFIMYVLV